MNFCTSKQECLQDLYEAVSTWDYDRAALACEAVLTYENTERFRPQFAEILALMSFPKCARSVESAGVLVINVDQAVMSDDPTRTDRLLFDNQREF